MRPLHSVLIFTALSAFLALQTGHAMIYHITYLLVATILLSGIWAWLGIQGLRFTRRTRTSHAQVGHPVEEHLLLHNTGRLPKLWLEVHDHSDLPHHRASLVINRLAPGERHSWAIKTLCQQRGRFRLGPATLVSSDPFGLFEITRQTPETFPILITPATLELAAFRPVGGHIGGGDTVGRRTHEITANVATVRDYVPGDAFKRIHWPSTARKSQTLVRIIVKEFELDPTAEVWLFLDLDREAQAGSAIPTPPPVEPPLFRPRPYVWEPTPNTEEYGVILAASLARYFVRRNQAVGLVAYGPQRQWLEPVHGPRQLDRILELLALVHAQGEVPLHRILEHEGGRLGRNGLACVITSSSEKGWVATAHRMARRGPQVIAFFVDPSSFDGTADVGEVISSLRTSGLPAFVLRRGGIGGGQVMLTPIGDVT